MYEQLELGGGVVIAGLLSAVTGPAAIQGVLRRFRNRHATPSRAARLQPKLMPMTRVARFEGRRSTLLAARVRVRVKQRDERAA